MTSQEQLRTGILIGGMGRRMGGPKQLLRIGGHFLIDSVVESLWSIDPPTLIGSGPVPDHLEDLERVADADGAVGPLAGVLGALESDQGSSWLIVACDQPWVTPAAIEWLLQRREPEQAAVMPRDSSRAQPFPGIYEPRFRRIACEFDAGVAISEIAGHADVTKPMIPLDLQPAWTSVNRPQDLERLGPESPPAPASRADDR